jgi:hypothetical protein
MADEKDAKHKDAKLKEIADLIGQAIVMTIERPESGQKMSEEDKEGVKTKVADAFKTFIEHKEWKDKTNPVINRFQRAYFREMTSRGGDHYKNAIKDVFPSLDPEFETHAILNLLAHLVSVGPFRKLKEETMVRIVEEMFTTSGLIIGYLHWRVRTTTPKKEDQH